ncbi:MAG: peptidoglycan-binding protein [Candidatus Paceibacterota bacterium]
MLKKILYLPAITLLMAITVFSQGAGSFFGIEKVFGYGGSSVATISSTEYTITETGPEIGTITNVPFGTSQADFLANLTPDDPDQNWGTGGLSDPIVTGDAITSTAEIGAPTIAYTIFVNPEAPEVTEMAVNAGGNILAITFSKTMDDPTGKHNQFTVEADGSVITISSAEYGGADIYHLNLGTDIVENQVVTVSYTPGDVVSAEGGVLAAFTDEAATNNSELPNYEEIFGDVETDLNAADITTNLTGCADTPDACTNLYFEKTGRGRITFTATLDLTDEDTITFLQNLNTLMDSIDVGSIQFDARTGLVLKNAGATIMLYGLNALGFNAVPNILVYNDEDSFIDPLNPDHPSLTNLSYDSGINGGTLIFTTSHFTRYDVDLSTKTIVSFDFDTPSVVGAINNTDHTVSVTVPNGTDVTSLTPTIVINGSSISPNTGVAQDFTNPVTYNVTANDTSAQNYEVTVIVAEADQTVPDGNGDADLDNTTPEVIITSPTQAVTVTVGAGTTNPEVNVDALITGGTGTLPQIDINTPDANVAIPDSTTVTSADPAWNGVIAAPTVTTVSVPDTGTEDRTLSTAIQVGFTGAKLSFDKAVRILIPGEAGKRIGYVRTGITFTEITAVCAADNQATGDALAVDGDCKIDVGGDLVIWTKHFTKFASFTATTVSGGGGGGGSTTSNPPAPPVGGYVLKINNGATSTLSQNVILTIDGGPEAVKMAIANGTNFATSAGQETYATTKEWTLPSGDGLKTVCIKFYNTAGYFSNNVCASIYLGEAPEGTVIIGTGQTTENSLARVNYLISVTSFGESSANVSELQQLLKNMGYFNHPEITGYFGSITQSAIQAYQNSLTSSGLRLVINGVALNLIKPLNEMNRDELINVVLRIILLQRLQALSL